MLVREVMSHSPTCCTYSCTAESAARKMYQNDLGFLPVLDNEAIRKLVGVVTDRDLCLKVLAAGRDPAQVLVHECMTANPVTCLPDDPVETALEMMECSAVRRLPVVDTEQHVLGVVSLTDLLHHVAAHAREICVALSRINEPRRRHPAPADHVA